MKKDLTALEKAQFSLSFLNYALNCQEKDKVVDIDKWVEDADKIRSFVFTSQGSCEVISLVKSGSANSSEAGGI